MIAAAAIALLLASAPAPAAGAVEVAPGERYRANWLSRIFFGAQWRDLWATRTQVPVLDLDAFDGGLTPAERGGGLQTKNLHFQSRNGREWVFRSVDKDATGMLDPETRASIVADILQDLTSTSNPVGALVAAPLLDAAGVLHATPRLMVMPDDPRLGESRKDFAGVLGLFEEREPEFPGQQKVSKTLKLFRRLERRSDERVDARAFLRARLMDVFLGDWDRHVDQWRWARFDEGGERLWRPVPRDRDQAFCKFDGIVPSIAEYYTKQLASFGEKYPAIDKITFSGRYSDRRFLVGLAWPEWESVAADLAARLSDEVIAGAVRHLPPEMEAKAGAQLAAALRARRDRLREMSRAYYLLLAKAVDVRATDAGDVANVAAGADGSADVSLHAAGEERPFFHRRFVAGETREIRLYMPGGKAQVKLAGEPAIDVRIVEPSDAEVTDRFADPKGAADPPEIVERKRYETVRDWGSDLLFFPQLGFDPSRGLVAGARAVNTAYGFQLDPFSWQLDFAAAYATTLNQPRLEARADFRMRAPVRAAVYAFYSGMDTVNFFGFGNESAVNPALSPQVQQDQLVLHPLLEVAVAGPLRAQLGATLKRTSNDRQATTAVGQYGFGGKTLGSVDAGVTLDTRTGTLTAERGFRLHLVGRYFPRMLGLDDDFAKLRGEASAVFGGHVLTDLLLGVRVAGERNFGSGYPFFEAAYVGGAAMPSALDITGLTSGNLLRGYDLNRFAGYGSAVANTDLRIALGHYTAVLPFRYGLVGLADVGRVFVHGESSSRWHTGAGGGLWLAVAASGAAFSLVSTFSAVVVRSDERTTFYFASGFGI